MFKCSGILEYTSNPYKLIVRVPYDIANYYYHQLVCWKHIDLNRQKYAPHISVVRKEIPTNISNWGLYAGKRISFEYDPIIDNDNTYYWLNAFSEDLEGIRRGLGLHRTSALTRSPSGAHRFHITIGNLKNHE